ncbi:MAG TPA: 4Fe-4S binding protein, partial [Thermoleophilia bacterium]|nr:4Fe-4S binding protein [Thermoleophilia bacterium]
ALCRALGIGRVREIDPLNVAETEKVLREELESREPSVVIATSPCVLEYKVRRPPWSVDPDICTGCKACLRAGCTAHSLIDNGPKDRRVEIDPTVCNGCGVCAQLCKYGAITGPQVDDGKDAR